MQERPKHRGVHMSFWITPEQAEKLDALVAASGLTRTKVWQRLLEDRPVPERSYWKVYSQLASIGGLIKKKVDSGDHGDAYKLGIEVVKIARALEAIEKERDLSCRQS